jgi:hypothetical protein
VEQFADGVCVGSLQLSPLAGRILFKDVRYHSTNMSARVLLGHITWRYWKWRIRKEDSDGQYSSFNPSSRADSGIQRKRLVDAKSTWKASNGSSTIGHHLSMPLSNECRKRKERLRLRLPGKLLLRMDRVRITSTLKRDRKL